MRGIVIPRTMWLHSRQAREAVSPASAHKAARSGTMILTQMTFRHASPRHRFDTFHRSCRRSMGPSLPPHSHRTLAVDYRMLRYWVEQRASPSSSGHRRFCRPDQRIPIPNLHPAPCTRSGQARNGIRRLPILVGGPSQLEHSRQESSVSDMPSRLAQQQQLR